MSQLQLGELEEMDGAGKPRLRTPEEVREEQAAYEKSLTGEGPVEDNPSEPVIDESDFIVDSNELYPAEAAPVEHDLETAREPLAPTTDMQLQAAADFLAKATGEGVSAQTVRGLMDARPAFGAVDNFLAEIEGAEDEQRKEAIYAAIITPGIGVDAKLKLIRELSDYGDFDVQVAQRQVLHRAIAEEAKAEEEPDPAYEEHVTQQVRNIPPNVPAVVDESGKPVSVMDELRDMYEEAEKNMSIGDVGEMFIPGAPVKMFNGVVARVRKRLGVTTKGTINMTSWLQLGTAVAELREMAEHASPEQKDRMAQVLMEELKANGGVVQDMNDLVALHLMSNIFSEEIYGKTYAPSDEEKAALRAKWEALKAIEYPTKDQRREMRALKRRFHEGKTEPILDNAFNILDYSVLGGITKGTIKYGGKIGTRFFGNMSEVAPKSAAKSAVDGLTDAGEATKLGMSPAELAEQFFPSAVGKDGDRDIFRGVNGVAEMTDRQRDAAAVKLRQSRASNLRPEERVAAVAEIKEEVKGLLSQKLPKLHLHQSDMVVTEDGTGVAIDAIFGKTSHKGWGTLADAKVAKKLAVEAIFGYDAPVEIVMRKRGQFVRVPDDMKDSTKGEFFQRAGDIRHVDSAGNTFGAITLADDAIDNLYLGSAVSMWTRGLNILDNFHLDMISTRVREQKAMESAFRGDFSKLAGLSDTQKQRLSRVVIDNEGTDLSNRQLQKMFNGDQKLVDAYNQFRYIDNVMYAIEDRKVINAYRREGLQDIRIGEQRYGFGRQINNADDIIGKSVFDPSTGIAKRISKQEYEAAIKGGDEFAQMKYDIHGQKGQLAKIVRLAKGTEPRFLPLPATGVLPRIPGHFPHIFKYNYIVKLNGQAVKGALTRSDAEEFVKANPGKGYQIVDDAALNSIDSYAQHLEELSTNRSGLLFGKRSAEDLENLSPWAEASKIDPIEALFRGSEILSATATKGDMIQSMRVRLFNYLQSGGARGVLPDDVLKRKGAMGLTLQDFASHTKSDIMAYNKAKAYMRRIDMLERSPDALRRGKKAIYKHLAHYSYMLAQKLAGGKGSKRIEKGLLEHARSGNDVLSASMGWMHRNYIAIMAPKQFPLQAAQSLFAGVVSPTSYMKAWRQFAGVSGAVAMRMNQLHGAKFGIKQLDADTTVTGVKAITGMDEQEFRGIVRLITESGLVDAVSHNTMIREAVSEAAQRAARRGASTPQGGRLEGASRAVSGALRTADQATYGIASKYGFEAGENMNQILSLLTLYNRDKARGVAKLGSRAYQDDLIGRTSVITGNMVREAGYQYSRSILKPLFQWIPFQHSMILLSLPKSWGGTARFSGVDKAKILAAQFVLFGSASSVLVNLAHKAIEEKMVEQWEMDDSLPEGKRKEFVKWWRSEPVQRAMDGFVSDYLGNKVMQALFGEKHPDDPMDFAWGKSFAPGAGSEFMAEKLWNIGALLGGGSLMDALGVQGEYGGKVLDYIRTVRDVVSARREELDPMPLPERVKKLTELGANNLFPVYGKWVTGRWAAQNEAYISQGGTLGEGYQNDVEIWLGTFLGVDTKDRESYYAARKRLGEDFNDTQEIGKAAKDAADRYWENLVLTAVKFKDEAPSDDIYNMLLNEHLMNHGLMLSALPEADYELFMQHVEQKLERVYKGEGTTSEKIFVEGLNKKLADGGMGSEGPSIYSYLKHLDFIKNNPEHATALAAAWEDLNNSQEAEE